MGIIIRDGIIYSPIDYMTPEGGVMSGPLRWDYSPDIDNNVSAIRFTKDSHASSLIGSRASDGITGNISFNVFCGAQDSNHYRSFNINGYDSDKFTVRFGKADFGFIEQSTFNLEKGKTYNGTLVSKPYVVLIFPVVGNSGSGATTTTNNPVYTATGMNSTGFTFKNLTDFTKFRYVALGVPSDYSE